MNLWCILLVFAVLVIILITKKLLWVDKIPNIRNKHVLITGGSSGIGKSVAVEAAKLGANVTIIARDVHKLELAIDDIKKNALDVDVQKINYKSVDVSASYNSIEDVINSIEEEIGPIYLLVNCAGTAVCKKIEDTTENDYRHMMDLNFYGTVFPTLAVVKKMKRRNAGHIVITGSQGSLIGLYGMSAYCSSKFALRGFAESLNMELLPYNITVTLCLPPDTNTPGFENEQKSKPEVTRIISETGGLVEPSTVAHQMLSDVLNKSFFSTVGLESLILTILCSGMTPIKSYYDGILQISLMSFLRLISIIYNRHFEKIILNHVQPSKKKLE